MQVFDHPDERRRVERLVTRGVAREDRLERRMQPNPVDPAGLQPGLDEPVEDMRRLAVVDRDSKPRRRVPDSKVCRGLLRERKLPARLIRPRGGERVPRDYPVPQVVDRDQKVPCRTG